MFSKWTCAVIALAQTKIWRISLLAATLFFFAGVTQGWANCGPAYGADGIAVDSKGNVWITHYEDVRIGRLNPGASEFAEFLPTTKSDREAATRAKGSLAKGFNYSYDRGFDGVGLDEKRGVLWTTLWNSGKVVKFSLKDNTFSEITVPGQLYGRGGLNIDHDGNVWLVSVKFGDDLSPSDGVALKISPEGKIVAQIPLPYPKFAAYSITLDRQGKLWLAQTPVEKEMEAELYSLEGSVFKKRTLPKVGRSVTSLVFDSAGNLWFGAGEMDSIVKLSGEKTTMFKMPSPNASPIGLYVDGRDNIWFTEYFGDYLPGKIARLSPNGDIREYPVPAEEEWVVTLSFDADGNVWFSTILSYNLFRLDPDSGVVKEFTVPVPSNWHADAISSASVCSVKSREEQAREVKADPTKPLRHPNGYPSDKRAVLFESSCNTQCHTWYRVDKVANRRTEWAPTVDRMIRANGAKFITNPQKKEIIRYLNERYTAQVSTAPVSVTQAK